MATPAVAVGTAADAAEPLPLEQLFDNRAVAGPERPGHPADFDGAGNALPEADLNAAGWRPGAGLDLDAAPLTWPEPGPDGADNVVADGQRVRLEGRGDAVSFLVAATSPGGPGPAVSGRGTVHYTDGSTSGYTLSAEDWRGGSLATKAVALPHIATGGGTVQEKAKLYAVTVPVREGQPIGSVELPRDPGPDADLHVFAAAVRPLQDGWSGSWSASTGGYTGTGLWEDQTLRLVVHTSRGGQGARIRLENTFASTPVRIGSASVAVRGEGAAAAGPPVPLRFDGGKGTVMAAGERAVSDPVDFDVPENTDLLVSLHLPGPVPAAPVHSEAIQRSYLTESGVGDRTGETGGGSFTRSLSMWPFLTGVDVRGGPGSVVALGDSITDGVRSTEGTNRRWPDVLARRLEDDGGATVPQFGVLNHGISANRIVTDRYPGDGVSTDTAGVSAQHRLERDVFAQTNVRTVVLFEGINDVRWDTPPEQVVAGMRAIAERARERGLRVVAATLTPCEGYKDCTPVVEERRTVVNRFIRENDGGSGVFDDVLDFDAVIRDPQRPQRMLPAYDSGDHLHPGDAGLRALGESVDLPALRP
ncbi:SGNH/GDSL hydrolase family protein [Streptomyces sp. HNM0574]|uniref:SGNH/GDSL hydrolase family protein n=1 Tax=Streptomyces sp. HNM0574 TaxID=2714954 RepID=UPI001F0E5614|nr:SGNH/GDSL hydrolase family protein [Streptomyces sp. HNM0574]